MKVPSSSSGRTELASGMWRGGPPVELVPLSTRPGEDVFSLLAFSEFSAIDRFVPREVDPLI